MKCCTSLFFLSISYREGPSTDILDENFRKDLAIEKVMPRISRHLENHILSNLQRIIQDARKMSSEFCNHYGQRIFRCWIRIPAKSLKFLNTQQVPLLCSGTTSYTRTYVRSFQVYILLNLTYFMRRIVSRFFFFFVSFFLYSKLAQRLGTYDFAPRFNKNISFLE